MGKIKFPTAQYLDRVLGGQSLESSVTQSPNASVPNEGNLDDVIAVANYLFANRIDITSNYDNWIRLAACFSSTFGEQGRPLFHTVCQIYSGYTAEECDKLYTNVSQKNKNVVGLGTFYHLCKEHGVDVGAILKGASVRKSTQSSQVPQVPFAHYSQIGDYDDEEMLESIKPFAKKVEKKLPEFLRLILTKSRNEDEKDMVLLSAIVIIASVLGKKVKGMYDNAWVYPTLFLLVVGKAASRKGIINAMRGLVAPIQEYQQHLYKEQKQEYLAQKAKDKDAVTMDEPKNRMHCIPANSSAAAFFTALTTMMGCGLVIDTEIDTMIQVFKQDWGNFSETLRKTFQHEVLEIYRKTNDEYYYVEEPLESIILSGTMMQFVHLINSVENGLFSRFLFFMKRSELCWQAVKNTDNEVDNRTYFKNLGQRLFKFYQELQTLNEPVIFELTNGQWKKFNSKFNEIYDTYLYAEGADIHASVVRFGLIAYRIMMVLTMLRVMTSAKEIPAKVACDDRDYQLGIYIAESVMPHMAKFYEVLEPEKRHTSPKELIFNREDMTKLYKALPKQFETAEFLDIAITQFNIPESTAKKWLKRFSTELVIVREKKGRYRKNKKV